ncbi:Bacterial membrane flanked domain protein [Planctomycetes bacterium Pan216]|uniref:Bacterial membrane flanked domain protein n=1 Tax=Kolteria novifilia TaxID=2527975 RepID=A0A518AXQ0_9BACT|nr:Bacterial membrane flanked domain protein [Planctomycetes bacterium Pan216]
MDRIECPACGTPAKASSDMAGRRVRCPTCDHPFQIPITHATVAAVAPTPDGDDAMLEPIDDDPDAPDSPRAEHILWEGQPSVIRTQPIRTMAKCVMLLVGVILLSVWTFGGGAWVFLFGSLLIFFGAVMLLRSVIHAMGTRLTITNKRSTLRRGLLSKFTTEVRHKDVLNLQVRQTIFERLLDTGTIEISSAGQGDIEIQVTGLVDPDRIARIVRSHQN